jgi:hypothetical protein
LLVGQDAVGVISVQSYTPNLYDEVDLDLLQRLGNADASENTDRWQPALPDETLYDVYVAIPNMRRAQAKHQQRAILCNTATAAGGSG